MHQCSAFNHTSKSSYEMPTMQLDILDTIREQAMEGEEKRDNNNEDQDIEDFEAMPREVNIIMVHMSSGSASLQCWGK